MTGGRTLAAGAIAIAIACARVSEPSPSAATGAPLGGSAPVSARTLIFDSDRTGNFEIFSMLTDGSQTKQLTNDARFDAFWGRLSPDRTRILFYRTPKGVHDTDFKKADLWAMNVDGSGARELRPAKTDDWELQGHAEWSPDGSSIVMSGGSAINLQIFVTNSEGRAPRAVTKRAGTNIDPSYSPDGKTIVFVGCPGAICFEKDYEIYTAPASGGEATRLTQNDMRDHDPYFSRDGKRIAWLAQTDSTVWNVFVMNADGTGVRNLTNDRGISSRPEWSADGQSIFFHRLVNNRFLLFTIKPDGSGLTQLAPNAPGNNEYPSN